MKQLAQIIAFFLLGSNSLEIIIVIGTAMMLMKIFVNKLSAIIRRPKTCKQNLDLENDMWAIE